MTVRHRGCRLFLLTFSLNILLTLGVRLFSARIVYVTEHPRSRLMAEVVAVLLQAILSNYRLHRLTFKPFGDVGFVEQLLQMGVVASFDTLLPDTSMLVFHLIHTLVHMLHLLYQR